MSSLTMPGMGSGLDINSMVQVMVMADLEPKMNQLQRQENDINEELAALSQLESSINTFLDVVTPLQDPQTFGAMKVVYGVDSEDYFSITPGEGVVPGTYNLRVEQLAVAQKQTFQIGDAESMQPGTYTIGIGEDSFDVEIAADDTQQDVVDQINNHADNPGVSANIVNGQDDQGNPTTYLTLTSDKTGEENAFTVKDSDGNAVTPSSQIEAKDAVLYVDGVRIQSSSNEIDDAIPGMTINLKDVTEGEVYDFTIESDTETMTTSINAFVDAWNVLMDDISGLLSGPIGEARPALAGDTMTMNLQRQLRTGLSTFTNPSGSAQYKTLADIGITTDLNGNLEVDDTKLQEALTERPGDVSDMFTGSNGLFTQMQDLLEVYVGTDGGDDEEEETPEDGTTPPAEGEMSIASDSSSSSGSDSGLIQERVDSLNDDLTDLDEDWEQLERRQEQLETRYSSELIAMDLAIAEMNNTMNAMMYMMV